VNVTIAEEVLLLAHEETTGKPLVNSIQLDVAVGGAILAELAVRGRIDLDDKRVVVLDRTPCEHEELDGTLDRIAGEAKRRKPEWWISKLQSAKLRKRLLARLTEHGVLDEQRSKVLGLFPLTRYPERDASIEREIRERVQRALDGAEPDERVIVLIAVLRACNLDRKAFPGAGRQRVKEIAEGDWVGPAVAKTIASINSAMAGAAATTAAAAGAG
jgi:hypothetical protein